QLDPKVPEFYNSRGFIENKKGDTDSALADFNRAIQLNPQFAYPHANRAGVKLANRDFDGAIEDCNHAIELALGNDAKIYVLRGLAWNEKRAFERARADFNHA